MLTRKMNSMKLQVSTSEGRKATVYISPTEVPNWSARTMRMVEGGKICAKVPEAMIVQEASFRS